MSYTIAEYVCPEHDKFDALVTRPTPDSEPCPICGVDSPWTISGPMGRVKLASATQGKVQKADKETWLNTEALGEGMPLNEWKKERQKMWDQKRRDKVHREAR